MNRRSIIEHINAQIIPLVERIRRIRNDKCIFRCFSNRRICGIVPPRKAQLVAAENLIVDGNNIYANLLPDHRFAAARSRVGIVQARYKRQYIHIKGCRFDRFIINRRRDRYRPRLICLRNSDIVRRARVSRRGQCNAVIARAPSDSGLSVHVLVRNRQRGMGLFNAVGHLERTATGDNDARVLFCRSTAGLPFENNIAGVVRGEGVAEFVDDGSDGIDLTVIVNLAAAKTITIVGLRPVTIGNRAFAAGHAADNATAGISTGNRTSVKTIFNFCTRCTRISENAASVFAARNISRIIAISNGQRTSIHLTDNAANTCRFACACR